MDKLKTLKKSLTKEAVIIVFITIAIAVAYYFISSQEVNSSKEARKSENKIRSVRMQIADIERKNTIVKSSIKEYNNKKTDLNSGKLSIDNKRAKSTLNALRKKYRINNLNLNISPEEEYQDKQLKRESYKVIFSEMDMSFDSISDLHTFSFLNELKELLPGYIHPTYLKVKRERQYNQDLLRNIAKGERPNVVSANIRFLWFGIPKTDDPTINLKNDTQAPPFPMGATN